MYIIGLGNPMVRITHFIKQFKGGESNWSNFSVFVKVILFALKFPHVTQYMM